MYCTAPPNEYVRHQLQSTEVKKKKEGILTQEPQDCLTEYCDLPGWRGWDLSDSAHPLPEHRSVVWDGGVAG